MFVEVGSFNAPKTVLCIGMRPDPGGVVLSYLHSNQNRLELASEQIFGLTHEHLNLALKNPPFNPVSPFLNLKRENVPAVVEWSKGLDRKKKEQPGTPRYYIGNPGDILVEIGTYSFPKTISPIVFQPDGRDVSISYLDESGLRAPTGALIVRQTRIMDLSYGQLLMIFRDPPADDNSPFLNLKVENIPRLVERTIRSRTESVPQPLRPALRLVTSSVKQWLGAPQKKAM